MKWVKLGPVIEWANGYSVSQSGSLRNDATGRVLKGSVRQGGYISYQVGGRALNKPLHAHRAVLFAFVGPPPAGTECCHNNGDPADNRLANLRWDTRKSNAADRKRHGRETQMKVSDAAVAMMRELATQGYSPTFLAKVFGLSAGNVSCILTGAARSNASGPLSRRKRPNLTPEERAEVRRRVEAGATQRQVAAEMGIAQGTVSLAWLEVNGPVQRPDTSGAEDRLAPMIAEYLAGGVTILDAAKKHRVSAVVATAVIRAAGIAGRRAARSAVDDEDVARLVEGGASITQASKTLGITQPTATTALNRARPSRALTRSERRLGMDACVAARLRVDSGELIKDVARSYKCAYSTVHLISLRPDVRAPWLAVDR